MASKTLPRAKNPASRRASGATLPVADSSADWSALVADDFEPATTKEVVAESERRYNEVWGFKRRVVMYALTRSRAQLVEAITDEQSMNVILDAASHARDWQRHLRAGLRLAKTAEARLIAAAAVAAGLGADSQRP